MMSAQQRTALSDALRDLLKGTVADSQLADFWNRSQAEFFFEPDAAIRLILAKTAQHLLAPKAS